LYLQLSLYLELADVYRMCNRSQEATRTMQEAMAEFQGSPEEIRCQAYYDN
jgi:tetratricopeptide repeat protein 21B